MHVGCTDHGDSTTDSEGGDTTDASGDNEDQQPGHRAGLSWDKRKPPTKTVALEALRVIQNLLRPPHGGKRKGYKDPKVNGWSKRHLQEIETMLNLYTGEGLKSRVHGWQHQHRQLRHTDRNQGMQEAFEAMQRNL
jgi:hypothetical protein